MEKMEISRCKECNGKACICDDIDSIKWAAHCMNCDNTIGVRGYYDPCAKSREEAIMKWNKLNEKEKDKICKV